ncbi:hypothetical protein CS022_09370 [Veronia nyctiphanis]|uniref:DUF2970 domain-containing protein n=1 Tax=Veronia nyctiphanis TaxID=1278244 RepID=A0A4Q0YW80_9GAMM|nr:DUF2970 domain-containing protein [Veronia nyctiphanis]RXJ73449.1 hypothetical protein CS022_09370 [Veronia nyctiphanis]
MSSEKTTWWDIVKSVFAALLGVQSDENRQRDFSQTSMWPYIITGIVAVVLFVLVLIVIVSFITPAQ